MKKLPFELPFELDTLQQLIDTHHLKLDYQILADIPFRQEHFPFTVLS